MIGRICERFLSEGHSIVFLLARFSFLGKPRNRIMLNTESKEDLGSQESFFRAKLAEKN